MITAGTRKSFTVRGRCVTTLTTFASDVRSDVLDQLSDRGWTVYSLAVSPLSNERLGDWDYIAYVTVSSPVSHASIEDMVSVIRGAFWNAAGSYPTVSTPGYAPDSNQPANPPLVDLGGFGGWATITLVAIAAVVVYVLKRG